MPRRSRTRRSCSRRSPAPTLTYAGFRATARSLAAELAAQGIRAGRGRVVHAAEWRGRRERLPRRDVRRLRRLAGEPPRAGRADRAHARAFGNAHRLTRRRSSSLRLQSIVARIGSRAIVRPDLARRSRACLRLARDAPPTAIVSTTPAMLMYTSGTTGTPKGALLSHGNLRPRRAAVAAAHELRPHPTGCCRSLPLYHVNGQCIATSPRSCPAAAS